MKVKNVKLEWYVLHWDINKNAIDDYNILMGMKDDIAKQVRSKKITDIKTLKEYLKRQFMYHYWSKAECEFYTTGLSGKGYEKIDMWRQIEPNLNQIVMYVNSKMNLNFE